MNKLRLGARGPHSLRAHRLRRTLRGGADQVWHGKCSVIPGRVSHTVGRGARAGSAPIVGQGYGMVRNPGRFAPVLHRPRAGRDRDRRNSLDWRIVFSNAPLCCSIPCQYPEPPLMSRRCVIAVLAILSLSLFVVPAWAGSNTWTATGPTGGAIRAVLVEDPTAPSASSTVYVGTLGSGVFKSVNGGDAWAPSGLDGFSIRALARDPTAPGTLYAGGENATDPATGGVFSSQDGVLTGRRWTTPGSSTRRCRRSPSTASHLYAGTAGGGVFRLDAGTWTQINTGLVALAGECSNCPPGAIARHRFENPGHGVRRHRRGRAVQVHRFRCELGAAPDDHQPGVSLGLPREGGDPGRAR